MGVDTFRRFGSTHCAGLNGCSFTGCPGFKGLAVGVAALAGFCAFAFVYLLNFVATASQEASL
jgi:hypothetical protein